MIVVSNQMTQVLYSFLESDFYSYNSIIGEGEVQFNNYNFNPAFLNILSQEGDKIEIPTLVSRMFLAHQTEDFAIKDIAIPLIINTCKEISTPSRIINYFCSNKSPRLNKVITKGNNVYYGAVGLILDSNFDPIVISMDELMRIKGSSNFSKIGTILKINPKVFISSNPLEKAIIKSFIPYYTIQADGTYPIKIEVCDISKYIARPIPPKGEIQEHFKDIISQYKEEILDGLI